MGVSREELLLLVRALKRGFADLKAIRKALERRPPGALLEALRLKPALKEALRTDPSAPDPEKDRGILEPLREALIQAGYATPAEWEGFAASFVRAGERPAYPGIAVPREFDGFTLQWELARRERGVVYRARDAAGRDVALKVYRKDVPAAEGLPRVEGHAYVVSAFAGGETLEERKPSRRRAVQAIEKAARLLEGRVHGALTPARIALRRDDSVEILGFEAARAAPLSSRARSYGDGDDVRALGAILYEILAGAPPAGETSPAARAGDVDPALDRVVAAALSGGYGSPRDFADDLARWLRGEPITARRPAPAGTRRRRWPWIAAAAAALALAAGGTYLLVAGKRRPAPAAAPEVSREEPVRGTVPAEPAPAEKPREETATEPPVVPLAPGEEERLYADGVRALAEGDQERFVAVAGEAVARGSRKEWFHSQLAAVYLSRQRLDRALVCVSRALDLSPGNRDSLRTRAEIYAFRGETAGALEDFDALYGHGAAELNLEIVGLSRQVEADPSDPRPRLLRGIFYCIKRHFGTAEEDFTAAIDLGLRRALAWRARACLAQGAEGRARAAADARAVLSEFPGEPVAREAEALLRDLGAN